MNAQLCSVLHQMGVYRFYVMSCLNESVDALVMPTFVFLVTFLLLPVFLHFFLVANSLPSTPICAGTQINCKTVPCLFDSDNSLRYFQYYILPDV